MAPGKDRIANVGDTVEIMVGPFTRGAISVQTPNGMVSVRCTNDEMAGKTLGESDVDFLTILIHSGASCFGMVMEICIEAIGAAVNDGGNVFANDHFAELFLPGQIVIAG
ncbi:MAG: hypothetical protein ACK4HF_10465 [Paracoccaceae bacterium]